MKEKGRKTAVLSEVRVDMCGATKAISKILIYDVWQPDREKSKESIL